MIPAFSPKRCYFRLPVMLGNEYFTTPVPASGVLVAIGTEELGMFRKEAEDVSAGGRWGKACDCHV